MTVKQDHSHVQYRLDEINELEKLLHSGETSVLKCLEWQEELDWQKRRLQNAGHAIEKDGQGLYQFVVEEEEEERGD